MGYIINNHNFYAKSQIVDKCKEILTNNKDSSRLEGDDLNFINELLKYYPIPKAKKLHDIKQIRVGRHSRFLTILVMDSTGREREVSYGKAVTEFPWTEVEGEFIDDIDKENIIRFGKYEGLRFEDAVGIDPKYFQWLLGEDWIWISVKAKIRDLLEKHYEKNKVSQPEINNTPEEFDWSKTYISETFDGFFEK